MTDVQNLNRSYAGAGRAIH